MKMKSLPIKCAGSRCANRTIRSTKCLHDKREKLSKQSGKRHKKLEQGNQNKHKGSGRKGLIKRRNQGN
jgi:hypothetical protein